MPVVVRNAVRLFSSPLMRGVLVRVITMVISGVSGILTTRLLLSETGADGFALFSLLASLPVLLVITDMGVGAAIVNVLPTGDSEAIERTLLSVIRISILSCLVLASISSIVYFMGWIPAILGFVVTPENEIVVYVSMLIFGLTVPLSIGQRIFLGVDRYYFQIGLQGLQSPLTLLLIWIVLSYGSPTMRGYAPCAPFIALAVVSAVGSMWAGTYVADELKWALSNVRRVLNTSGAHVMDTGLPMLVQLVAVPAAVQSDRLVLSHISGPESVSAYSVVAQVYAPLQSLVMVAGVSLWPFFAKQRATLRRETSPLRMSICFALAAALPCSFVLWQYEWIVGLVGSSQVEVSRAVVLWFSLALCVQASLYPLAMSMMDVAGLRFQVVPVLLMSAANLGLSLLLAGSYGVSGVVFATVISAVTFQFIPYAIYVAIRRRRRSAEDGGGITTVSVSV